METAKVLAPRVPIFKGNELTDYGSVERTLKKEFTTEGLKKIVEEIVSGDEADADSGFAITKAHQGLGARDVKYGQGLKLKPQEVQPEKFKQADNLMWAEQHGVSIEDIEKVRTAYESLVSKLNIEKRGKVALASGKLEDHHLAKKSGKGLSGMFFSDVVKVYFDPKQNGKIRNVREETTRKNRGNVQDFINWQGDRDITTIDRSVANSYADWLENGYKKPNGDYIGEATLKNKIWSIRSVLRFAVNKNWLEVNVFDKQDLDDRGKPEEKRVSLTKEQIKTLIALDMPDQYRLIFRILACTGFRLEEAIALQWQDIKESPEGIRYFDLHRANMVLKTPESRREIPIHKDLIPYIDEYQRSLPKSRTEPENSLFTGFTVGMDSKASKSASKKLMKYTKQVVDKTRLGLQDNHSLRHSFKTMCKQVPLEIKLEDSMVNYLGGWKGTTQADEYGADSPAGFPILHKAINAMNVNHICGVADE